MDCSRIHYRDHADFYDIGESSHIPLIINTDLKLDGQVFLLSLIIVAGEDKHRRQPAQYSQRVAEIFRERSLDDHFTDRTYLEDLGNITVLEGLPLMASSSCEMQMQERLQQDPQLRKDCQLTIADF